MPINIFLNNLSYGNYNLKIRLKTDQSQIFECKILVDKPYWLKWYAILFYTLIVTLFIFLIVKLSISINVRKKEKELDKVKLEIKALSAQMNPHFTFNTINSIQHYIIQNDKVGGVLYLSEYAKLIRKSLEYSRQEHITLEQEFDFLKLYCNLEQKRFDKVLNLNIEVETQKEPSSIVIPSLLLQPIIENAIIHGINSTDRDGIINIEVSEEKKWYVVNKSDNGSGLLNANQNKNKRVLLG